jgi:uncharacterized protein with LGFP repeats
VVKDKLTSKETSQCLYKPYIYKHKYLCNIHDTGNRMGRFVGRILKTRKCIRLNVYDMMRFHHDPQPALVPILSHAGGMMVKEWKQLKGDTSRLGIPIGIFRCLHLSPNRSPL